MKSKNKEDIEKLLQNQYNEIFALVDGVFTLAQDYLYYLREREDKLDLFTNVYTRVIIMRGERIIQTISEAKENLDTHFIHLATKFDCHLRTENMYGRLSDPKGIALPTATDCAISEVEKKFRVIGKSLSKKLSKVEKIWPSVDGAVFCKDIASSVTRLQTIIEDILYKEMKALDQRGGR